jgi:hypothetical protein
MAKTLFGPGVIVTSNWLNGAREIRFDGEDLDWHFQPINSRDIQRGGETGLDTVYVTLRTDQTYGNQPIQGFKSFMGLVEFGDQSNTNPNYAPLSWNTNAKFNQGGSFQDFALKFSQLENSDIITKEILVERIDNFPTIDEGFF